MRQLFLCTVLLLSSSFTLANIPAIPDMYKLVASEQRIPAKLFYALILNESRSSSSHRSERKILPWPWTVNHRGAPHFFQTRREAFAFVSVLIRKDDYRFDVGLGQLNWRWHRDKFSNHWDAFDPYKNLSVAAKYLREQYDKPECNSWEKAVGCYHRPSQKAKDKRIASNYANRVIKLWKRI